MVNKNTFRLETVLRVRQRAFEEAQRVVARRLRAIGRERSIIETARSSIAEQLGASRVAQGADLLDVPTLRGHRTLTRFLHGRMAEAEGRIAEHEGVLEEERRAMVRASVAVKALEKLKERRAARWTREQERRRALEESEIALQRHRRNLAGVSENWVGREG